MITYLKSDATSPQAKGNKIICHICNDGVKDLFSPYLNDGQNPNKPIESGIEPKMILN
jgi:hypothetical protein